MKKLFLPLACCAGLLCSAFASGSAMADEFRPVATGAWTYGGDDWQVAKSADGGAVQIHGGGKFEIGAGVAWKSSAYPMAASLLANYHFDNSAGVNGDAKFTRAPIDAMVYYTGLEKLRFGVGLSYIVSPTVKATVDGQQQSIKFKNAIGKSFEIGYEVTPQVWTNLRLSSEKFDPKTGGNAQSGDVTHLSLNVSYLF
ncbi:outer membrane protein W [Oxalobacteraceae bacterium GrIS 1.11]